jgi:hypothetical protein
VHLEYEFELYPMARKGKYGTGEVDSLLFTFFEVCAESRKVIFHVIFSGIS